MRPGLVNARVTFRGSPIQVLERFTFRDVPVALSQFKRHSGLEECVIVQTCNRVELYGFAPALSRERIKRTWASLAGLDESSFDRDFEWDEGGDVLSHLLRLTAGLDSMVVGEEQILGQVRGSIAAARRAGTSGERMNSLFDKAVRAGTRIRNSTGIGRGGVSVGSMAVKLVEENIDDVKSKRILIIGTGEVSTLVAKSLGRRGYDFRVSSRTMGRANAFCEAMGGKAAKFEDVLAGFDEYDVLFVATSAPYSLVTHDRMAQALESRTNGMMILDLSNPRTVDERVATLGGIKLMNLDQIAEMVEKNMRRRRASAKDVESIISEEVPVMEAGMNRLDAEPIVKDVFKSTDVIRERELQKALRMLGESDESRVKIIDDLTKSIVEGILAAPMNNLRKASEAGDPGILEIASRLFDCEDAPGQSRS